MAGHHARGTLGMRLGPGLGQHSCPSAELPSGCPEMNQVIESSLSTLALPEAARSTSTVTERPQERKRRVWRERSAPPNRLGSLHNQLPATQLIFDRAACEYW